MRNLSATQEWDNDDPITLDPVVSSALRQYLSTHFSAALAASNSTTAPIDTLSDPTDVANADKKLRECNDTASSFEVEHEWVGIMGFTPDRCPLVGPLDADTTCNGIGHRSGRRSREYILAGYTGHGMPIAFLAGRDIAELIAADMATENDDARDGTIVEAAEAGNKHRISPVLKAFSPSRFAP